jgi:hypothetical protein
MNTRIIVGVVIALAVVGIAGNYFAEKVPHDAIRTTFDPLNATYDIDGTRVSLVNGSATQPIAAESASVFQVETFEAPEQGDLDFDGDEDAAMLLVVNSGGTGTFYYVVAAVDKNGTTKGTNAVLLGDRIAPQTMEIRNGVVIANYADRAPDEPFSARPSVGVSKYLMLRNDALVDVWPAAKRNLIEPLSVHPGDTIASPLTVNGRARGNWYFEASFPVRLKDQNGKELAVVPAQAQGEWMTTEFVPFSVTLMFTPPPPGTRGTLIFQKDNPSDLREFDDSLEFPIVF